MPLLRPLPAPRLGSRPRPRRPRQPAARCHLQHQAAAGLHHRALRRRGAERPADGARRQGARCSSAAAPPAASTRSSTRTATGRRDQVLTIAKGLQLPERHRLPRRRRSTSPRSQPRHPLRRDRGAARVAAARRWSSTTSCPTETHHGWKYLGFGPDGMLYVPVGAPCNVCERPDDERFATILRMKPDGTGLEIFARGDPQHRRLRLASADAASCGSPRTAATASATTSRRTS